jgi:hypothetical protein
MSSGRLKNESRAEVVIVESVGNCGIRVGNGKPKKKKKKKKGAGLGQGLKACVFQGEYVRTVRYGTVKSRHR